MNPSTRFPICAALLATTLSRAALELAAAPKPNIRYIVSDDHAAHAIGAHGGRLAKLNPTPTIDRLDATIPAKNPTKPNKKP